MTTIKTISGELSCTEHIINRSFAIAGIEHIAASDLMSEVLVAEEENMLVITALNTEQTIRTAHIVDALGVLLVNGKKPQPGMIRLAEEFDLALLSTKESMFESCAAVHSLLKRS
ncbi:MAG: hypothetical protein PQJ61_07335 [Spirochaetales bacterium]|uniref:DRTGG domain-containing protein n=1 Tax=Candidatus Thalassospirochaeta sargassi TaxID=3119039 RepID=A0AAJ1MJI3_9SPIO|nr:hypothetical protein [Spirochaetales bacterium]